MSLYCSGAGSLVNDKQFPRSVCVCLCIFALGFPYAPPLQGLRKAYKGNPPHPRMAFSWEIQPKGLHDPWARLKTCINMPTWCFQSSSSWALPSSHPLMDWFNPRMYLSAFFFHVSDFCDPEKMCSLWLDDLPADKEFSGASGGSPFLPFPKCPPAQQETSGVPLDPTARSPRGCLIVWSPQRQPALLAPDSESWQVFRCCFDTDTTAAPLGKVREDFCPLLYSEHQIGAFLSFGK